MKILFVFLVVGNFFAFNYTSSIKSNFPNVFILSINQGVYARMVREDLFIPGYLIDRKAIIRQNLDIIKQKFDMEIINGLTNLRLDNRYIGLEALARETLIRGAEPIMILEEILQVNLSDSAYPGRLNNEEWEQVANEISFFFDMPSELPVREEKIEKEIRNQSEIIDELINGAIITDAESEKIFIIAKNISHCVVLTFYDKTTQVGGMAYMIWAPQFGQETKELNISRIDSILLELEQAGVNLSSLDAQMVGGKILNINVIEQIEFIIEIYQALYERNINVTSKDILGFNMRHIAMDTRNGEIYDLITEP